MLNTTSELILVLGCQRSGTTLITAMLGRHSDISMLFEHTGNAVFQLIGTRYSGNKMGVYRQIRMTQRASRFGHLMNRLANCHFYGEKFHRRRPYPTSDLSIQDYIDAGARIIIIERDRDDVLASMAKRTVMSPKEARHEYDEAKKIMDSVPGDVFRVQFDELVTEPEQIMKKICNYLDLEYEVEMLQGPKYNFIYPEKEILKSKAR